jgi:hypothetical protein
MALSIWLIVVGHEVNVSKSPLGTKFCPFTLKIKNRKKIKSRKGFFIERNFGSSNVKRNNNLELRVTDCERSYYTFPGIFFIE